MVALLSIDGCNRAVTMANYINLQQSPCAVSHLARHACAYEGRQKQAALSSKSTHTPLTKRTMMDGPNIGVGAFIWQKKSKQAIQSHIGDLIRNCRHIHVDVLFKTKNL